MRPSETCVMFNKSTTSAMSDKSTTSAMSDKSTTSAMPGKSPTSCSTLTETWQQLTESPHGPESPYLFHWVTE